MSLDLRIRPAGQWSRGQIRARFRTSFESGWADASFERRRADSSQGRRRRLTSTVQSVSMRRRPPRVASHALALQSLPLVLRRRRCGSAGPSTTRGRCTDGSRVQFAAVPAVQGIDPASRLSYKLRGPPQPACRFEPVQAPREEPPDDEAVFVVRGGPIARSHGSHLCTRVTDRPSGLKVHFEILPGDPSDYLDAMRRTHLLSA